MNSVATKFLRRWWIALMLFGSLILSGCAWLPAKRSIASLVPPACVDNLIALAPKQRQLSMVLTQLNPKGGDVSRERLFVIVQKQHTPADLFTIVGLNPLGVKRFDLQWQSDALHASSAPFSDKQTYIESSLGALLLLQLRAQHQAGGAVDSPADAECVLTLVENQALSVNGEVSTLRNIQLSPHHLTFNMPKLGYNVALTEMSVD